MACSCYVLYYLAIFMSIFSIVIGVREYKREDILRLREEVREMFQHAYDSYLRYAYPYDELRPLSCDGVDTWGSYSLTLIDALDTLAIMGNYSEFNRVVEVVLQREDFDADINVSVFETNIRIVGGLLSAHLLSHKTGMELEPGWPCNGPLLRLAEDVAHRLIAAFDTTTGMPYGTINLRNGVPPGETSVTCTAGVGTFIVEFGTLSRLTGDPLYEEVAYNALKSLYNHRSPIGLLGNHIDVMTGKWTAQDSGIGGGIDSYFEYLVKGAILLQKPELISMFKEARVSIDQYLKREDWYVWASMMKGLATMPIFQSLEAYWPGVLSLLGETDTAMRTLLNYHTVWRQYGFTPEVYNIGSSEASSNRESYPLRPELIESIMLLYVHTKDPILLQMGEDILRSIQHSSRTECGYATIKDVRDHRKEDRMESFFLAETTKYLYLLFDPDNFIHNRGSRGKIINTPNGECIVDVGGYVFNTEAHPIDPTILHCCHEARNVINMSEVHEIYQLLEEEDNIKLMTMEKESNNIKEAIEEDITDSPMNVNKIIINATNEVKETKHSEELIKTESKTGYVNIDGTEREDNDNESTDSTKEKDAYSDYVAALKNSIQLLEILKDKNKSDSIDDIIVAKEDATESTEGNADQVQPPSDSSSKKYLKMLPDVIQDFLNKDWRSKPKCEPQYLLERLRKEKRNPEHPHVHRYELLLTPAPHFLQRISLAGEFSTKKSLT